MLTNGKEIEHDLRNYDKQEPLSVLIERQMPNNEDKAALGYVFGSDPFAGKNSSRIRRRSQEVLPFRKV